MQCGVVLESQAAQNKVRVATACSSDDSVSRESLRDNESLNHVQSWMRDVQGIGRTLPSFSPGLYFPNQGIAALPQPGVKLNGHTTVDSKDRHEHDPQVTSRQCLQEQCPIVLSLEMAIPSSVCQERRIFFGINDDIMHDVVDDFRPGNMCRHIPQDCQLHRAAGQILPHARTAHDDESPINLRLYVDGSFDPARRVCTWAVAAFDVRPEELVWFGCRAGHVPECVCRDSMSAFRAELFAQLMASMVCVGQDCQHVTVAYFATSAAGVATGDFSAEDGDSLAQQVVAAWTMARCQGKTINQVHVAPRSGDPGNELVDGLATYVSVAGVGLCAPNDSTIEALLDDKVLQWMWLLARDPSSVQLPAVQGDGGFAAMPVCCSSGTGLAT